MALTKRCALVVMLVTVQMTSTHGFLNLRLGGSRIFGTPSSEPGPIAKTGAGVGGREPEKEVLRGSEGGGSGQADEYFHRRQLQPNTMGEILTCNRVQNFIFTETGERCPRGWLNAPVCDEPDKRNLGLCQWEEKTEFELPNGRANFRAYLCKARRMKCFNDAGTIPGNTQLVHAPRNSLSDKSEFAEVMSHLKDLAAVDFARNDFLYLSDKTFQSNKFLRAVNFDLNFLLNIPECLFSRNRYLTSVSFVGNKLDFLPPRIFFRNRFLTIVNFERNNITLLPPEVFRRNHRLEVVRLTGNSLPNIPPGLFSTNPFLREVGLAHNRISVVPKSLFNNARDLQNIYLSGNKIKNLPGHLFDNCQQLRTITLDRNLITTLPAKLFDRNPKLSLIDISYNRLHVVSSDMFVNNPIAEVVNKQWKDHQGVLEEEREDGTWQPMDSHRTEIFYRKTILAGK